MGESAHPVREKLAPPQDGVTVFFGAVYVGKVHGLKRAVRLAARGERLFAVVTVGLADADESYRKQLEASVRAACPERLLPRLKQYRLRGRLNEPVLKGGDKFLLRLLHTTPDTIAMAEDYLVIVLAGAAIIVLDSVMMSGAVPALTANALRLSARKNVFLTERIEHLTRRSLREKVLSYLRAESMRAGSATFTVPFDRQTLADHLGCDRSALSAVLSKLRAEGVLDVHKSTFRLAPPR